MGELMKSGRKLYGILCNLFIVLMSLCDSGTNQVESMNEYFSLETKLGSIMLLYVLIKQLIYTACTNDLHATHNKTIAHINHENLCQEYVTY